MPKFTSFLFVLFFTLQISGCGDDSDPLVRSFGDSGTSYCEEVNKVFQMALERHISRSDLDKDLLYSRAITSLIDHNKGLANSSTLENIRANVLQGSESLSANRLSDCQDLVNLKESLAKYHIQFVDDPTALMAPKDQQTSPAIFRTFLKALLRQFDPFSGYLTSLNHGSSTLTFSFGVTLDLAKQSSYADPSIPLEVFATEPESPLKPHDQILQIGSPTDTQSEIPAAVFSSKSLLESTGGHGLMSIFSSSPKPYLRVHVKRAANGLEEDLTLFRSESDRLPLVNVEIFDDSIVYARLLEFDKGTTPELLKKIKKAINDIRSKSGETAKKIGIILDLRWNPGGLVYEVEALAPLFVGSGVFGLIRSKDRSGFHFKPMEFKNDAVFKDEPLIVLTNHASASASDISTQILHETHRAVTVGETSFGKGIGQEIVSLSDLGLTKLGGYLKLTAEQFYGPSGNSIQAVGNEPDVQVLDRKIEALKASCIGNPRCAATRMIDIPAKLGIDVPPTGSAFPLPANCPSVTQTTITAQQVEAARTKAKTSSLNSGDIVFETAHQLMLEILNR